jgi:hypothetical protein
LRVGHLGVASAIKLVASWGHPPNLLVLHAIHSEVTRGPPPTCRVTELRVNLQQLEEEGKGLGRQQPAPKLQLGESQWTR